MSSSPRIRPVTRIRGELRPTPAVEASVNRFLDNPAPPGTMKLFTTAQTVVDQGEYHRHQYDLDIRRIERELRARSLAQRAFILASPLKLLEAPNGSGRLFFNVQPKDKPVLQQLGDSIRAIEGLEEPVEEDLLYVEFAAGALARDRTKRREQLLEGRDKIGAELRHPSANFRMTASGLHVVTRDMPYPVKDKPTLPLAE